MSPVLVSLSERRTGCCYLCKVAILINFCERSDKNSSHSTTAIQVLFRWNYTCVNFLEVGVVHMFCELMRLQKRLSRMAQDISIIFDSERTHLSFLFAKKGNFGVFLVTERKK